MGLNSSQLNQLDKQIDENRTELVIMSREDAVHLAASNEKRQGPCTPLKVCSRSQNWMLDGLREVRPSRCTTTAYTNWLIPIGGPQRFWQSMMPMT